MRDTELLEEAGKVATQAVDNVRTVQVNQYALPHNIDYFLRE